MAQHSTLQALFPWEKILGKISDSTAQRLNSNSLQIWAKE